MWLLLASVLNSLLYKFTFKGLLHAGSGEYDDDDDDGDSDGGDDGSGEIDGTDAAANADQEDDREAGSTGSLYLEKLLMPLLLLLLSLLLVLLSLLPFLMLVILLLVLMILLVLLLMMLLGLCPTATAQKERTRTRRNPHILPKHSDVMPICSLSYSILLISFLRQLHSLYYASY